MTFLALAVASVVCLALLWRLGRTLVVGLRSGRMPHTDSARTTDRRTSPIFFWFLTLVFAALFVIIAAVWLDALLRWLAGA